MPYKVPFVDLPTHYLRLEEEILSAIKSTLSRGDVILREQLQSFEKNIASFVGTKYAVGVNSGFDALHLSLRAAGLGSGDEVITVAHTFVATVAAIVHCGARPVLIDVSQDFNMDIKQLERAITSQTRAIIPVYLNGRLCDMEGLMRIADEHHLIVIEDAAQALGASFRGREAGSFGLTGCFSLYPFKMLGAFGDGGIVVTNDLEVAKRITYLRDHGQDRTTGEIRCYGFNCRLDNLQASILDVKLKYLQGWIARRREIASLYHRGLQDIAELVLPPSPSSGDSYFDVFQNYVIRAQDRDHLVEYLRRLGIEVLISWPRPLYDHQALGLKHCYLPETEKICREVLSLPLNTEISDEQVRYVIQSIQVFYTGKTLKFVSIEQSNET